jgi:hypothetical protein
VGWPGNFAYWPVRTARPYPAKENPGRKAGADALIPLPDAPIPLAYVFSQPLNRPGAKLV